MTETRFDELRADLVATWRRNQRHDDDFGLACMTALFVGYADSMAGSGATGDEIAAAAKAFVAAYTEVEALRAGAAQGGEPR